MKSLKQSFQENGPRHFGKVGTPTAGGALFIPIGLAIGMLHAMPLAVSSAQRALILGVTFCTLSCSLIGLADDWLIITRESNRGISPRTKLALQVGCQAPPLPSFPLSSFACFDHGLPRFRSSEGLTPFALFCLSFVKHDLTMRRW